MRVLGSKKRWIGATIGVVVAGTVVTVALGSSPSAGFVTTPLATGNLASKVHVNSDRVKFQTKDQTDVRVARVNIGVGDYSGWHHHPGIVIAVVKSGALTFTHSDCSSKTYGPGLPNGAVFVESGDDPGQASNRGTTPVEIYATFVAAIPHPANFRFEDDLVSCP